MAVTGNSNVLTVSRLKREDHKHTKHDTHFSKWQVLIGPSDWEDYSRGKEGAAKYRVHNLPTRSDPGLYELGIAVSRSESVRGVGKLHPDDIAVVYLGQAENVRSRLQRYGRSGAHLGNRYLTAQLNDSKADFDRNGVGLFEEIFLRGHSIVFRWAPMKDKKNAEKTEAQLLETFDYAWNKGSNGVRRPNDILQKLSKTASTSSRLSSISKRFLFIHPTRVGIKIESNKSFPPPKPSVPPVDKESKSFLYGIFKFSRSQPRLVSEKCGNTDEELGPKCKFIMSDAVPCRRPPVKGRKRCEEHKGMRNYVPNNRSKSVISEGKSDYDQDLNCTTCRVNLGDGNFCKKQAVTGRKRCEEHKGMRIKANNSSSSRVGTLSCGVALQNGSVCMKSPVQGRKRCEQHKGMRVPTHNIH
ncbi:protein EFFECTOR OF TRANSCRIPTION 2-like [Mercurialis annua]|uniref:protein EFFECTOR OF TRANSCRIPTION 2-like n=1 Tax=Mercurialis annua TaxID=3986 RepID=UPI002160C5BE|nr:protein EFFECTOR OF TRANSCRIPTION 2-like [Mercurialis annua]